MSILFRAKMSVLLNNNIDWQAGEHYIVSPDSPGLKGDYKIKTVSKDCLTNKKKWEKFSRKKIKNKALYFNLEEKKLKEWKDEIMKIANRSKWPLIITKHKKLTWHIAQEAGDITHIKFNREILDKQAKLKHITVNIENKEIENYSTQNVCAWIKGRVQPDSFFVFTAHYDHLGHLGKDQYIPGANDNASGIAMLLYLAKHYVQNPPDYSILFIACGGEELGLLGSKYFVENGKMNFQKIKFLLNFDIVGTGDEGITAVNSSVFTEAYTLMLAINEEKQYLKKIKKRGQAANSDHWPFFEKGVPCFFIYTMGGIQAYHDVYDKAETLPLTEFIDLSSLIIDFLEGY